MIDSTDLLMTLRINNNNNHDGEILKVSTPAGFTTLTKLGFMLSTPFMSEESVASRSLTIDFEMDVLRRKLEGTVFLWLVVKACRMDVP